MSSRRSCQHGFYNGLDADRLDGRDGNDFLTEPRVTGYEIVRTTTTNDDER